MNGCQNHGPFLGPIIIWHHLGDPKGDHNFDNHPYTSNRPPNGIGNYSGLFSLRGCQVGGQFCCNCEDPVAKAVMALGLWKVIEKGAS